MLRSHVCSLAAMCPPGCARIHDIPTCIHVCVCVCVWVTLGRECVSMCAGITNLLLPRRVASVHSVVVTLWMLMDSRCMWVRPVGTLLPFVIFCILTHQNSLRNGKKAKNNTDIQEDWLITLLFIYLIYFSSSITSCTFMLGQDFLNVCQLIFSKLC